MARKQKLILLHSTEKKGPSAGFLEAGELALQNNAQEAAMYIAKGDEVAKFVDEEAVIDIAASAANTVAESVGTRYTSGYTVADEIDLLDGRIDTLEGLSGKSHEHANMAVLTGITAEKVAEWDAKQNAIAENTYDAYGAASTAKSEVIGTDTDDKDADTVKGAKAYAKDYADGLAGNYDAAGDADQALTDAKAYADGLVKDADGKSLFDAAGAAKAVQGETTETVASVNAKFTDYATSADTVAAIEAAKTASTKALEDYATSADTVAAIEAVDNKFTAYTDTEGMTGAIATAKSEAIASASAYTDAQIEALNLANTYAAKSYEAKVDTLIGTDTDKSARELAAEEVAKIVASADTKYDTLKEIADWIMSDTTGAAKMANDIDDLMEISADTRLTALEAISGQSHTHANQAELDKIATGDVEKWNNKQDAIAENTYDTYGAASTAKSEVIGTDADTKDSDTVKGAKKYADSLAGNYDASGAAEAVQGNTTETVASVDAKFASYATSADTVAAIGAVNTDLLVLSGEVYERDEVVAGSLNDLDERIDALEAISGASHEHANMAVLTGITAEKVAEWDAKQNAIAENTYDAYGAAKAVQGETTETVASVDAKLGNYVKGVEITNASGVTSATTDQVITFDFGSFVLDCGTYE